MNYTLYNYLKNIIFGWHFKAILLKYIDKYKNTQFFLVSSFFILIFFPKLYYKLIKMFKKQFCQKIFSHVAFIKQFLSIFYSQHTKLFFYDFLQFGQLYVLYKRFLNILIEETNVFFKEFNVFFRIILETSFKVKFNNKIFAD